MRLEISDEYVEVRLARWEKVLGLMGDIRVPRAAVADVQIVPNPLRAALRTGLKAGLRLPGLYYVARSIKLDRAWVLRRGMGAVAFAVEDGGVLRHVVASTPHPETVAKQLGTPPAGV